MRRGFLCPVAILDWFSRCGLAWRLSNSLEVAFCLESLSVKYEEMRLKRCTDEWAADESLSQYFAFYNTRRPNQALEYQTSQEVCQAEAA